VTFSVQVDDQEISVGVVETLDGLRELEADWRTLLESSENASGFLTWEWLYSWSEQFIRDHRRLLVLTFKRAGEPLVGIAPLYVASVAHGPVPLREIGVLGFPEGGSDYLGVIASRGKERLVARSLLAVLFGAMSRKWDTLQLSDVRADSVFLSHFLVELRSRGKQYAVTEGAFCPQIRLPATFDEYLHGLSAHGRQAYRRKLRALNATEDVEHVIYRTEPEIRAALLEVKRLYEKRWERNADELFGLISGYLPRAANGWPLEVSLLRVAGRPVAGLVHLTNGRTIYQYVMAVDRAFAPSMSIGNLVCGMDISAAIESGFLVYDFLKGEEPYKFQFMNGACRSLNVVVHGRTLRSLAAWTVDALSDLGKIILR
jgi:CelD/BcsL family acetyltransferase involved in cellulose biosynthesis